MAHVDLGQHRHCEGEASADDGQRRWVGLAGLVLVFVLLVTVFATPENPAATAGPAKVASFVQHHRTGFYLNAYLTSLAVLIAASFLWYLRDVVSPDVSGRRLANLGFAGGLLFVVGGILSAGSSYAMADVANHAAPSVLQMLNILSQDVSSFAGAATALLIGATSLGLLQSKALPGWLGYFGLVLAAITFALPGLGLLGVALWWLVVSIVILLTSRSRKVTGHLDPVM